MELYCDYIVNTGIKKQILAFKQGFKELIPVSYIKILIFFKIKINKIF